MTAGATPGRGWLRDSENWIVETFTMPNNSAYIAGGIPFSSARCGVVDEAYPLGVPYGTPVGSLVPFVGTIWDHGSGGTVAATLAPQQFKVNLVQMGAGTVAAADYPAGTIGTLVTWTFLLHGA